MFLGKTEKEKDQGENIYKKTATKGENIETEISVSLKEAFYGMEKTLSIRTAESKIKKISVTIPQGIQNGERIRLIGQGRPSENGGKNGDLLIKINIEDNHKFKLKDSDLYTDLLLTPWEAALGARTSVESIDDETKIYIPQGIQSGEKIKIPNKGYQKGNGRRGDLIAEVKVVVPKQLTDKEKAIFEELRNISAFNPRKSKN